MSVRNPCVVHCQFKCAPLARVMLPAVADWPSSQVACVDLLVASEPRSSLARGDHATPVGKHASAQLFPAVHVCHPASPAGGALRPFPFREPLVSLLTTEHAARLVAAADGQPDKTPVDEAVQRSRPTRGPRRRSLRARARIPAHRGSERRRRCGPGAGDAGLVET
jgi:hypothetical protein